MQGQRNYVQPFHDTFEFDHGSNSSSSGMNQQVLWNNMLFNPVEIQSMTDRIVSSGDPNMPCLNMPNQDGAQLSIWGTGGSISSQHPQNQGLSEENKLDHGWMPPATITSQGGPRVEENHFEASRALSLENINISRSTTQIDGVQSFPENNSRFNNMHQNTEHAAAVQVGTGNEISESRFPHHPYTLGFLDPETIPSSIGLSNHSEGPSESVGFLREDDERHESSLDGRRISCKRKNSEGFPGQSSASGNASSSIQSENNLLHSRIYNPITSLNISSLSGHPSVGHSIEEYPAGFGTFIRGVSSDFYPSASAAGNAESSRRNYRMRINPAQPHDVSLPNSWSVNTVRQSDAWLPNQPPSHSISMNHNLEPTPVLASTSSQNQPHIPIVPGLPQLVYHFPWNGAPNSRIGSSSGSFSTEDRMIAAREGSNLRNMTVTSNLDIVSATDMRNMTQDQANWSLGSRSMSMVPSSQGGTNSGLHPNLGSAWVPHQNPPNQYPQPLAEAIHPSLFPPSSSESGAQGANFPLRHSGHSFSSQEVAQQIRASLHGPQPSSHIRSGHLIRRRNDGLLGAPLTMRSLTAAGEERSRMLSEIRHALESLRRGDGLRFETLILAGSELHDRHRDMRLDVDNMSYEELLALEERIGNVCTGLSEETILKCLRQRKYSSATLGVSMEHEPCSICQEEYVEGEDLGTLDCGHDFHTVCIKQWLMHKNLCPICKNTALIT